MYGPRISPTGDKNGLLLTYEKGVYSFHCDTPSQCYWRTEPNNLKIERTVHLMMTVPSSLLEQCNCELNSNGDCKCPIGVDGPECSKCTKGFWSLNQNEKIGCKSKLKKF